MTDWLLWIWEIYKLTCAAGVTVIAFVFLIYWLAFKDEIAEQNKSDREHIARSGGM